MLPRNGGADLLPRGPFAKPVLAPPRAPARARRRPPAVSQPSGQGPVLVGIASAVPDLQLGAWSGRPVRVVETLPGLRIVKGAIGLRDKDLRGRVVAVVQVHSGAVRGVRPADIHAQTAIPNDRSRARRRGWRWRGCTATGGVRRDVGDAHRAA